MMESSRRVRAPGSATVLISAMMVLATACAPNHDDEAGPMAADTARGIVEVTGAQPVTGLSLRTPDGIVALSGPAADALRQASGVEVWVAGSRAEDGRLHVEAYRVRAVGGIEASDGILELDGDAAVLVTPAGERVRYAPAPYRLRAMEGRHVWISGTPGGEPQAWGLLEPER